MTRATAGCRAHGQKTSEEAAPVAASQGAQVFFISDKKSGEKFLVDTGANRSLYPRAKVNDPGPMAPASPPSGGPRSPSRPTDEDTLFFPHR